MKIFFFSFRFLSLAFLFAVRLAAQPPTAAANEADQAWQELQAPVNLHPANAARNRTPPADFAQSKIEKTRRAFSSMAQADRAKDFYTRYSHHEKVPEAKLAEVRALVDTIQAGDATVEGRLAAAVLAMRSDQSIASSIQVQGVAAFEFLRQTRNAKSHDEWLKAIEPVARRLAEDFPDQPQGFETLLTIAQSEKDDGHAQSIARELLKMPAPAAVQDSAQKLLAGFDLVGKPLAAELSGANEVAAKEALQAGLPTILYSWATWSQGSLALAASLKQRHLAANIIALNLDSDLEAAFAVARTEAIVGHAIYDPRGRVGALAQRLHLRNASQILLVDARGVICEVRGENNLAAKLKQLGL